MSSNSKPVHRPPHIVILCSVRYALNRIRRETEWVRSLPRSRAHSWTKFDAPNRPRSPISGVFTRPTIYSDLLQSQRPCTAPEEHRPRQSHD
ncbi:hypothetical protein KIN20_032005 [Parelaphostrongylus tenuis]|uniref:Uncharacterized protein n=1 Tax=Parelaphostrongylus tenuis TaxID=148309 RepID=A0AAD5WHQ7_PARTN|nr:hypothetical protein KIN20_032005 [Parelaphostrongylus tenuis]